MYQLYGILRIPVFQAATDLIYIFQTVLFVKQCNV